MADIKFIAKAAGVSIATVSRVMNHTKPVSPALEQRVMAAVRKYDYRPNQVAKALIMQQTSLVGILLFSFGDPFTHGFIEHMEHYLHECGYYYVLASTYGGDMQRIKQNIRLLEERCVEAIYCCQYLTMEEYDCLQKTTKVPLVFPINSGLSSRGSYFHTCIDEERAGYDAAKYLISLGHRRMGCISLSNDYVIGRSNGFCAAMLDNGIEINRKYIISVETDISETVQALLAHRDSTDFPTAWFCGVGHYALTLMLGLMSHGLRIPEDISVIGCDDDQIATCTFPKLTAIQQPKQDQSQRAVRALMYAINNTPCDFATRYAKHELVVRDSCAPPKQPT